MCVCVYSSPARFPTSGASPLLPGIGASANALSAEQQGATKPIGPSSNRGVVGPPSTPSSLPSSSASSQEAVQPSQSTPSDDYASYSHEPSGGSHSEYGEQADDGGLSTSLSYDDPSQLHSYYPQPVGLEQLASPPGVYDQNLDYYQQQQYGADYNMYGYDHFGMPGVGFNQQRGPQKQQQQPRGPLNLQQQQQQQQRPGLAQSQQPYRPQQQQQPPQGLGPQSMYGKPAQGLSPQDKLQQPVQPQQPQQGVGVGQQKKFAGAPGPIQQQPPQPQQQQQQQGGLQQVRPQGLNGNAGKQGPSSSPQPGQQPQPVGLQQQRPPAQGAHQLQQAASIYGYDQQQQQQQRGGYNSKPAPYPSQPLGPYGAKPQQPNSPQSYKGGYNKQQQQYGKQQQQHSQQQQQFPAAPYPGMQPAYPPYGYPYSGYPVPAPYGYPQPQYQQGPPGFAQRGGYQPAPSVPYQQQYGSGYTSPSDYSQQPYENAQVQAQQVQHDYGKYAGAAAGAGGFGGSVGPSAGGVTDNSLDGSYGGGNDWQQQQQPQQPQQQPPQQGGVAGGLTGGAKKAVGPDSDPVAAAQRLGPYQSYPLAQPSGAGHVGPQAYHASGGVAGGAVGAGGAFGHAGVVGAGVPPPSAHANAYSHPAAYEQRQYQGAWAPSM